MKKKKTTQLTCAECFNNLSTMQGEAWHSEYYTYCSCEVMVFDFFREIFRYIIFRFGLERPYCSTFKLSICARSPEISRRENVVEQIYAAACCTLQSTQGTSATQSERFSPACQFCCRLSRLEIKSSTQFSQSHSM